MTTSFDRQQQAHDANTEPPEPCEHEPDWHNMVVATNQAGIVCVPCANEYCDSETWAAIEETDLTDNWD